MNPQPKRMSMLLRIGAVLVALLLTGEALTRAVLSNPVATQPDPDFGWTYTPHAEIFHTKEGWAVNRLNSMGFNDQEPGSKLAQTQVIVVGDSVTEALQVGQADNFTTLVEHQLPCLDVFNAGRSGLSPVYYSMVLNSLTNSLGPDLVILDFILPPYRMVFTDSTETPYIFSTASLI